jgi:hypothetical protein
MIIKEFRIRYIGTEPFENETLKDCLFDNNFDEGGILEVDEIKPTIKVCLPKEKYPNYNIYALERFVIPVKDVKEFIRLLKDETDKVDFLFAINSQSPREVKQLLDDIIDKLAGDKLI